MTTHTCSCKKEIQVDLDVLLKNYAFLVATSPAYIFWCVLNELGCGSGCGYYNFIPQFMLPHTQRPNPYGSKWLE